MNNKIETPSLQDIMAQWEKDSQVDSTEPGKEIIRTPLLHSKYNRYLTTHMLSAKKCASELNKMKKLKWLYYNGKMDKEELARLGWEQFQFTLKSDISVYIDGDEDLNRIKQRQCYHEESAKYCENVMKELQSRTYQLRSFMEWERFIQGAR